MEKKYYRWRYDRMSAGELWDISGLNPLIFVIVFLRHKVIPILAAPDIGSIFLDDLNQIEWDALPPIVMNRLKPKISECEKEGIVLDQVFEPPHLTPDYFNTLFLKSDDARILCILQIFVLRRNTTFSRCAFKCVTFCTNGDVIETNDASPEVRGPACWKLEHKIGASVSDVVKRHRERIAPLEALAKALNSEQSQQEIINFTNQVLSECKKRDVLVEMTEQEVLAMKWKVDAVRRTSH